MGLVFGALYIGILISLHALTVSRVGAELQDRGLTTYRELMAGPTPANPLAWDIVVEIQDSYQWGRFDWLHGSLMMSQAELPAARSSSRWNDIMASGLAPGFLRWVRYPWLEIEFTADGSRVYLMDARYTRGRTSGFGASVIELSDN